MITRSAFGQALCGLAVFLGWVCPAMGGSFSVNPVRVTLSADQPVGSLTVRNTSTEPTVVQLETSSWSQHEDHDVYAGTNEILATPPIFTIPPGGFQIIRVGLRRAPDPQRELTYRMFLREIPSASTAAVQGLRVALLVSLPVFVSPPTAAVPVLRWRALHAGPEQLTLQVQNAGTAHVQIGQFSLSHAESGQPLATQQVAQYVLPGDTRTWKVKINRAAAAGTTVRVHAQTDAGPVRTDVRLENSVAEADAARPLRSSR